MTNYYTYRGYGEIISGPYKEKRAYIANFYDKKIIILICDYSGTALNVKPEDVPSIFEPYLNYSI